MYCIQNSVSNKLQNFCKTRKVSLVNYVVFVVCSVKRKYNVKISRGQYCFVFDENR